MELTAQMLERESSREKNLEKSAKEAKARARRVAEDASARAAAAAAGPPPLTARSAGVAVDAATAALEDEFFASVAKAKEEMGL